MSTISTITEILESIKLTIEDDDLRTEVYYGILEVLEENHIDNGDLVGIDPILDTIIEDASDDEEWEDEDEEEEEDWDDQGRETF
jgi:hypothetical protein